MADDVLVVEDDPQINELVGAYVQLAGLEYRRALTGAEALSEFARSRPAIVVLDIMLPDIDGFEVCRQIKRSADGEVRVIFLTALDTAAARRRGMECGAAEYLTKPFDPDQLLASLERHATRSADASGSSR